MSKKYFWLKLSKEFFNSKQVMVLQSMDNGAEYIILWLKLLLATIQDAQVDDDMGCLKFDEDIPYSPELMSKVFGCTVETARSAVQAYVKLKMVSMESDGTMWARDVEKLVGSESDSAERTRQYRKRIAERNGVSQCDKPVTIGDNNKEKEIDKEIDKDKEPKKKNAHKYSEAFEEFWKEYPRKIGKMKTYKAWSTRIKEGAEIQQLMQGMEAYSANCVRKKTGEEYIMHPATFLGPNENWKEWADRYEPPRTAPKVTVVTSEWLDSLPEAE